MSEKSKILHLASMSIRMSIRSSPTYAQDGQSRNLKKTMAKSWTSQLSEVKQILTSDHILMVQFP